MTKSTDELMNELIHSNNIGSYLKANSEYMIKDELSTYLANILKAKQLVKSAVIKKSELSEVMGYQIFSGTRRPSRDSLISLCVAMGLRLDEVQQMLKIAGFAQLYPKVRRDSIMISGIDAGKTVVGINEMLYDCGEATLNQ